MNHLDQLESAQIKSSEHQNATETYARLFLRLVGSAALLATVAVIMPYSWMDSLHQALGMGKLPDQPIVGYLARSTSAFYALLGGLLWQLSFDLRRHRSTLGYVAAGMICFGITLTWVDWCEGLPLWWRIGEGPINLGFGLVLWWLRRGIGVSVK